MASKLVVTTEHSNTLAAAATRYLAPFDGESSTNSTESFRAAMVRAPGTYDYLTVMVSANSLSGTIVIGSRVNSAAGNQTLTVSAGTTGTFQDTTHNDALSAGQTFDYEAVGAVGTGTATFQHFSMRFAATTNSAMKYGCGNGQVYATASSTYYSPIAGHNPAESGSGEANYQQKFLTSATLRNAQAIATVNARTTDTVIRSRIGGANGNLVVTVVALTTGSFEDSSNSDALSSGSLVALSVTTGSGVGSQTIGHLACDVLYPSNVAHWFSSGDGTFAINQVASAGNNVFMSPQGRCLSGEVTEANCAMQNTLVDTQTMSNMAVYVPSTGASSGDTVTFTSRVNSAAGNQSIAVSAGTSGYFEDTTHSDALAQGQTLSMRSASGGSLGTRGFFTVYSFKATGPAPPAGGNVTNFFFGG